MRPFIDPDDRRFLAQLHRLGSARIGDLCETGGVTATAVRKRLVRMQDSGWIERATVRSDRGRPHHVYRVTNNGLQQLGDNYDELTALLWQSIQGVADQAVRDQLLARLRTALVERYGQTVTAGAPGERMRQLQQELAGCGYDVEVDERDQEVGQLPILRENHCPYHELAQGDGLICDLEQSVFEEILGFPIERTQCCRSGDACCEFEPAIAG